jgi:hypothetical protein
MRRRLGRTLLIGGLVLGPSIASAQAPSDAVKLEYAVKAAYLYKCARFVAWPDDCRSAPTTIALVGLDPMEEPIRGAVQGKRLEGREIRIARLRAGEPPPPCSILWLGGEAADRVEEIARSLHGSPILLAGDRPGFALRGGAIGLVVEHDRVALEINPNAAAAARVRISSRLLGVARLIPKEGRGERVPERRPEASP